MEIKTLPAFKVIGKKVSCPWEDLSKEMPLAWQEILASKDSIPNRTSPYILDICLHLRDGIFTQLVGVQVSEISTIPELFEAVEIPEQHYIYSKHVGSVMEIADKIGQMIKWGQENNYTLDPDDFKIQYTPEENESEGYDLYFKII